MSRVRSLFAFAVATFLLTIPSLTAQKAIPSPVEPRIVAAVDESRLVALRGSVPGSIHSGLDLGRAPASAQLTSMRLVLSRSPQQEAALKEFMAEQITPGSPNYHHWLTPEQFGKLYGPADADIQTLVTWLQTHGFTVQPVAPGRISISFSGSVAQVEAAFHTEIHSFDIRGEKVLSNVKEASIPAALAPVVSGFVNTGAIRPRPFNIRGNLGSKDPQSNRLIAVQDQLAQPSPLLTSSGNSFFVTPTDAAVIYDTTSPLNLNGPSTYNGAGVTIGIGGEAPIQASTVTSYRQRFLGDSGAPTITNITSDPATSTDAQDEAYLDTELAGGLAPGAAIHYYASADLFTAVEQAATDNTVDIFSLSFGACEQSLGDSNNQFILPLWQQFAAQGITLTVSTGDSGSAGCDNPNTEQTAQYGLQVNALASTQYNLAIGGTDFAGLASNFGTYVGTTNSSLYGSAKSYIPESTWNDSTISNGALASNAPYLDPTTGETNIVGGSGGASNCVTSTTVGTTTTCTAGYPKPSWQTGPGVPADGVRDLPDLSLFAGNGADGAAWLVCTDATVTSGGVTVTTNCSIQSDGHFYFFGYGGTSTAAPATAGILALLEQQVGGRIGNEVAPTLYSLAAGTHASEVFHDITKGNISVPCITGTPNCQKNTAGNYFLTGFDTTSGYDLATGLGSMDVTKLLSYWSSTIGTETATVTVTPSSTTIAANVALTVTGKVTGANGTPTGSVTLTSSSTTFGTQTLTSTGTFSFNVPAGTLGSGTPTLTVKYGGDVTYATATGTASVTVTKVTPTVSLTPTPSDVSPSVDHVSVQVVVNGGNAVPTGSLTVSDNGGYVSPACTLATLSGTGQCTVSIPTDNMPNGTDTLTANYGGDTNFNSATGVASIAVHSYNVGIVFGTITGTNTDSTLTIPVTITGVSGVGTPTGTVTIAGAQAAFTTLTLTNGAATFTFAPGTFYSGSLNVGVTYNGDNNYKGNTANSIFVAVDKSPATITVVPAASSIQSNTSLQVSGAVSGGAAGTPTGSVTLSGGGYTSQAIALSGGKYSLTIPINSLAAGTDTLTVAYAGDNNYNSATGTATVTVTQFTPLTPTVTVTPASTSINTADTLSVAVKVTGTGATPGGSITLTSGSYSSGAQTLSSGAATINIPANTFAAGSATLTAAYGGDANYATGSGTASITVTQSVFAVTASTPTAVSPGTAATSTITVNTVTDYTGSVALTCALTTSPTGAQHAPSCTIAGSPVSLSSSTASGTATATVTSVAPSSAKGTLAKSTGARSGGSGWTGGGAAALLAAIVFFGIPARRRAWRAMLGVLVLCGTLAALSACGSGGSGGGGGGGGTSDPGTTAGDYTFTVTATGTPSVTPAPTTTFTLHIN